ncbi:trans-Aconitate 2-methyltransferase [Arthrobacter sp. Hiyo8]|nr:trans-Aconitate 2-methyltransferase [Arthrobacter sp. Hiyo8]
MWVEQTTGPTMEDAVKWDPAKYIEFGNHRDRPFFDLTSRILAEDPGTSWIWAAVRGT